jgi:hypothetical protein
MPLFTDDWDETVTNCIHMLKFSLLQLNCVQYWCFISELYFQCNLFQPFHVSASRNILGPFVKEQEHLLSKNLLWHSLADKICTDLPNSYKVGISCSDENLGITKVHLFMKKWILLTLWGGS